MFSLASDRAAATAVLWSLVAPGGAFVVVENGSAKGSHTVRSARKMILRPTSLLSLEGEDKQTNEVVLFIAVGCLLLVD